MLNENINIDMKEKKVKIGNVVIDMETQQITVEPTKTTKKPLVTTKEIEKKIFKKHSKKTKEGMDKLKKSGKIFTSSIYGWAGKKGALKPVWKEQHNIIVMSNLRNKDDWTLTAIAKKMNDDGIKGKRGGKWTAASVKNVFTNEFHKNASKFRKPKWFANSYNSRTFKV